jgi:6-phosphogluconolactonase
MVNERRQEKAHAHCILPDPTNRYALAPDLGMDRIVCYRLDLTAGRLLPNPDGGTASAPGMGPRHIVFHPSAELAFVVNELGSSATSYRFDPSDGSLREIHTQSTLPDDFHGENTCADIHVDASGRSLYASNRGHDSIAVFAIESGTGRLENVQYESTRGSSPRNFVLAPGDFVYAANQNTGNIVGYRAEVNTGRLTATGFVVKLPRPVCIKMLTA